MISFLCNRCSQLTISVEGLHCFYCDQEKIRRNEFTGNFYLPVPEPGNEEHGYYETVVDVKTRKFVGDLMLFEPSTEISIQIADDDINHLTKNSLKIGNYEKENCTKRNCSPQRETCHDFKQDSTNKRKRLSDTLNTDQEDYHPKTGGRKPQTDGTFIQLTNGRSLATQQWKHSREKSAVVRFENYNNSVGMLKRQEIVEPTKHINEASKLDFAGSILFQPEKPPLSVYLQNTKNVSEQARDNIDGFFSSFSQKNSEIKVFQGNSVANKIAEEKKAQTSSKRVYRHCEKCCRFFLKDTTFYAHVQSNCDPNPYKCDKCGAIFSKEWNFKTHQRIHTRVRSVKCKQCDSVTVNRRTYNAHMKLHAKKRLFMKDSFSK